MPPGAPDPLGPVEPIERAERFLANSGARIEHGGYRAYYRPSTGTIQMPDEGLFVDTETMTRSDGYCATRAYATRPLFTCEQTYKDPRVHFPNVPILLRK
jgi:antirestriction protein ArdC